MRITILGDIMVQQEQYEGYRKGNSYDFTTALASVEREFRQSDYIVANLETPIAGEERNYTYDKYTQYSAVYHIDLTREGQGLKAGYHTEIFCNHLNAEGQIISEPVVDYLNQIKDSIAKKKVEQDYQMLLNRIFRTTDIIYPIQKEYEIRAGV